MLLVSKYTATKQLVSSYLSVALSAYADHMEIKIVPKDEIALYKSRDESKVLYISRVALKLSKAHGMDASAVANQIVSHFYVDSSENLRVEIVGSSIHIEVSDSAIATCLQSLIKGVGKVGEEYASSCFTLVSLSTPYSLLPIYAHARCCSLLRLVQSEGLMPIVRNSCELEIPWLTSNQKLRFNHPASYRLIAVLVMVVDDLVCSDISDPRHWQKVALNLSRAFESFWCSCRIFGEEKTASPELAVARIGLVIATQVALKLLLEEKLNISAVDEL